AGPQVQLLPLVRELNATVQARVHRDHDLRPVFVTDCHVQPLLLALREVSYAAGRLGSEQACANGIADRRQALVLQGLDEVVEHHAGEGQLLVDGTCRGPCPSPTRTRSAFVSSLTVPLEILRRESAHRLAA